MVSKKINKGFCLLFITSCLVGCSALPSSGPSGKKVVALGGQQATTAVPEVEVIDLDESIVRTLYQQKGSQSLAQFGEGRAAAGVVNVGDVLDITIWEAPPAVLFGGSLTSSGSGSAQLTKLPEQMVSERGTVSIPFVGDIAVSGKTPGQIQEIIKGRLKRMANQPQVMVRMVQNNAANVSVVRAGCLCFAMNLWPICRSRIKMPGWQKAMLLMRRFRWCIESIWPMPILYSGCSAFR